MVVTKTDLIHLLDTKTGLQHDAVRCIVEEFIEELEAAQGKRIKITTTPPAKGYKSFTFSAIPVGRYFAISRDRAKSFVGGMHVRGWTITHVPTTHALITVRTAKIARALVALIEPLDVVWDSTDPKAVMHGPDKNAVANHCSDHQKM